MFMNAEERALSARKPYDLCERCFLELEAVEDSALEVYKLHEYLEKKHKALYNIVDDLTALLGYGYEFKREDIKKGIEEDED
jgi:hypothetical protein